MVEKKTQRIAKNTLLLYIRMIVVMIINLYTVRVVLNALGSQDYGIYNAVAGVVALLNCVCSVLTTSTQRFYSVSLGRKDDSSLNEVFSVSLVIFGLFSLAIVVIGESAGLFFVNQKLGVPIDRLDAANWTYHCSILIFVFSLLQVPYSAAVVAHEDMGIYAVITTAEFVLKLLFAVSIPFISIDKLVYYSLTLLLAQLLMYLSYAVVCRNKYSECSYNKPKSKVLFKKLLSFSGWTLFSSVAGVGMNQVNTILMNIFFGPVAVAARAIALQVHSAITAFQNSVVMAIRSPMISTYAEGNFDYLNKVFNLSNKFIIYGLLMICLPLFFEMDIVLKLWLGFADKQMVLFTRLMIVYGLILSLNNPISIIVQATGKLKEYSIFVEFFTLICPVITYILYKFKFPSEVCFYVMILAVSISHFVRIICLKRCYPNFDVRQYLCFFIAPATLILIVTAIVDFFVHICLFEGFYRLVALFFVSVISVSLLTLAFGLTKDERIELITLIRKDYVQR